MEVAILAEGVKVLKTVMSTKSMWGGDLAEGVKVLKTVMSAKSMWGGGLWAKCRKIERGVQLRLAMQRSLPQFKLVAHTSK